jgi:hypothetical protein
MLQRRALMAHAKYCKQTTRQQTIVLSASHQACSLEQVPVAAVIKHCQIGDVGVIKGRDRR